VHADHRRISDGDPATSYAAPANRQPATSGGWGAQPMDRGSGFDRWRLGATVHLPDTSIE